MLADIVQIFPPENDQYNTRLIYRRNLGDPQVL